MSSDTTVEEVKNEPKKLRGFAAMDPEKVKEISRLGGITAHKKGKAHQFTSEEARSAGSKGGRAPHRTRGPLPKKDSGDTGDK